MILFTQDNCPPCRHVKALLAQQGVAITERNISHDRAAYDEFTRRHGGRSVPALLAYDASGNARPLVTGPAAIVAAVLQRR